MTEPGIGVEAVVGVEVARTVGGGVGVDMIVGESVGARSISAVGVGCD